MKDNSVVPSRLQCSAYDFAVQAELDANGFAVDLDAVPFLPMRSPIVASMSTRLKPLA